MTGISAAGMRVLLVCHYYPPHRGGIEHVVREQARGLVALGADVTVLTSGERNGEERLEGVRVVRVAAWNGLERRAGVPFPVFSPRLVPSALRWARWADVIHAHDCLYPTSWLAAVSSLLTRTPLVLTQHVALVDHPSAAVRAAQQAVYATAGRGIVRRASTIFTLNAAVARYMRGLGASEAESEHLPNGVESALYRPARDDAERDDARRRLGLPPDRPLVLFVGRLVPKKGFDVLVAAQDSTFDLVVVGEGDGRAAAGRPGVHLLGAVPPERVALAYRACDLLALPSVGEGFPLTVQEAMASGLPVVMTDDPGYAPYRLDAGQVAFTPRDPDVLRAILCELVKDEPRRRRMARSSLEYAYVHFSWPEHVRRLVGAYRAAGAAGRGAAEPVPTGERAP